jgi:hypothetical protein
MRMIDFDRKCSVKTNEVEQLLDELSTLLQNPEANKHFHVFDDDISREISCSIITDKKLANLKRYNKLEQQVLSED